MASGTSWRVHWSGGRLNVLFGKMLRFLGIQGETIAQYGTEFLNTPADTIHVFVESIRGAIACGEDPRKLPQKSANITFWV